MDYVRLCPTCGGENLPSVMRCACGALLAGVDLVSKRAAPATEKVADAAKVAGATIGSSATPAAGNVVCPFEDCAQPNPAGSTACLYCNRPLSDSAALTATDRATSLLHLPRALSQRYEIVQPLPSKGAEAELLLVKDLAEAGPLRIAKIYRHGIRPRQDVMDRIAEIDPAHCVVVLESGTSDGHAYELMEFCAHGSLRNRMRDAPFPPERMTVLIRELSTAVAAVHAVGLLHRDLKPENVLVRSDDPLDLVLTDFGIASVLDATQRFTGTARTLPYASPESLSGVIDAKTDFWSLGMILLEAALGRHPFSGLSEAVILHRLTTRGIDVSPVHDPRLKLLLRGLLSRDPGQRWGAEETARWLAGDEALSAPTEQNASAGFTQPYHVGDDVCHTREQLAVALARNWRAGADDIKNGQLLSWFRDVQKDQNAVRVLLELRFEKQMHADVQLLKFILHLAPGIPPVWRGESIEVRAILMRANQSLKGDEEAKHWLSLLHRHRVLEAYAAAGNRECADIVQRWHHAVDQFDQAWEASLALLRKKAPERGTDEYANFDQLVFGNSDPERPSPDEMHARLLALAYDAQWSERLRKRLGAELAGIMVHCPWIVELGDVQAMSPASLLVVESLLPEARKVMERQIKADERTRTADAESCRELAQEYATAMYAIRRAGASSLLVPGAAADLAAHLDRYFELLAKFTSSGRTDEAWLTLRKNVLRTERIADLMRIQVDELAERRAANSGWLSMDVLVFMAIALFLVPFFFGNRSFYILLAAAAGIFAWRVLPTFSLMRSIKNLAKRL